MFFNSQNQITKQLGIFCGYASLTFLAAALLIGAAVIFGDLVLGYAWVFGVRVGVLVVLALGVTALAKLNAINLWKPARAPRFNAQAVKPIAVKPIAYTLGGPAFHTRSHHQPPFVSLTTQQEVKSYASQAQ